nr:alcohol dehydrogenase catalytic domain-containing protein [Dysosmobacter acutus]
MPALRDGQALVRIRATGLCGTDVMVYEGGLPPRKLPITNGHEAAGTIEEIRGESFGFRVNDAVFFRGSWGCGRCEYCLSGAAQLCRERRMLGVDIDGTMAEYAVIPTAQLFHLSEKIPFSDAQSLIGISCGLNLVHRIAEPAGKTAVIFGPGHNGLIILQLLRHAGFGRIVVVVGHRENRARLAMELGADKTVAYDDPRLEETIDSLIPDGPDIAVEASGSVTALKQCIHIVRKSGQVLAFSIYRGDADQFPVREFYNKGITVTGVKGAADCYREAEELLRRGAVRIDPLITHRFPLEKTAEAFAAFHDPEAIRIIVENQA